MAGHPSEAQSTARDVMAHDPANVQAQANMIRFLAWSGRDTEARGAWEQLRQVEPRDTTEKLKLAEAAAMMDDDQRVYALVKPIADEDDRSGSMRDLQQPLRLLLAMSEANLGKPTARRRLKALEETIP